MFTSDYKWQHDYVRLALDTGFCFERYKSDDFDRNKISSLNIDRIIEERDFTTIERFIPCVSKFALDPDQAQILDESFVKTFRLSQLAIQYLVYCKKYLDNTLIIVKNEVKKLREENKELNLFVDDLKGHIASLMKEIDEKPTFKCPQCNKIFSTEDFLKSHIKRRHSVSEGDTDKLQMEIKELKGRLNDAEKIIHKEHHETDSKDIESKKIEELQQKFEDLRLQVQSELKILQTQHNLQEKYEKLVEKGGGDLWRRRESTTQTEVEADGDKENVPQTGKTEKQIIEFGEALETKVTSSLQKIENQMQSFWNKLSEMERYRRGEEKPKPMIRSRMKESESKKENIEIEEERSRVEEKPKYRRKVLEIEENEEQCSIEEKPKALEIVEPKKDSPPMRVVASQMKKPIQIKEKESEISTSLPDADDTTTSETITSETPQVVKPHPLPRKRPHSSSPQKTVIDDELLQQFRLEVEKIIMGRLQDLGVSPDWKALPTRSFQRALEIVNHQATLMKKTYPNFDFIATQIEKNISEKLSKKVTKSKIKKSPKIEIKNRKMYETDSDSELKPKTNLKPFSAPYSAVIAELTSKLDSDKSEVRNEDQTKGVLKSYPSVGSLTKKKVLFNLEADKKDSVREGGSTTSITSSVFDATPRKEDDKKKDKDKGIEDLSDFDFSEM